MEFLDLPDDKLIGLCETMDDKSLWNLMQVNKRVADLCSFVIENRRNEYTDEQIQEFINGLKGKWSQKIDRFNRQGNVIGSEFISATIEDSNNPNYLKVSQPNVLQSLPIIENMIRDPNPPWGYYYETKYKLVSKDFQSLLHLYERLMSQKWTKINQ